MQIMNRVEALSTLSVSLSRLSDGGQPASTLVSACYHTVVAREIVDFHFNSLLLIFVFDISSCRGPLTLILLKS
jgi:hypothetical protein